MTSKYTYKPLNEAAKEIRVLCFDPQENSSEKLKARIEHISLLEDSVIKYFAVSYTWGDASTRKTITIDGVDISVPINSEIALRNLHNPAAIQDRLGGSDENGAVTEGGVCRIWLDAVCINQDDLQERAQQVGLMRDVYSKAVAVLVWLGEDPSDIAAPAFESVLELARSGLNGVFSAMSNDGHGRREFIVKREALPETLEQDHIQTLFALPWFARVWTIQEAVLNERTVVVLGRHSIGYGAIQLASISLAQRHYNDGYSSSIDLAVYRTKFNRTGVDEEPNRLIELLERMPFFSATEPRDRVYGALGLIGDKTTHAIIDPSYTRPLAEVYARATVAGIVRSGLLRALTKAANVNQPDPGDETDKDMASWAIKCHWKWSEDLPVRIYSYRDMEKCATDFSKLPELAEKTGWRVLPLKGVFLGGIVSVSRVITQEDFSSHRKMVEMMQSLWEQCKSSEYLSKSGDDDDLDIITRILWVLIEARYIKLFLGISDEEQFLDWFTTQIASFAHLLKSIWDTDYADFDVEVPREPLAALESMLDMGAKGRRFFITHNGILGRGPPTIEPGDLVCELKGGEVPFVLRQEGEFYRLIGDCFADKLGDLFIMAIVLPDDTESLMSFDII